MVEVIVSKSAVLNPKPALPSPALMDLFISWVILVSAIKLRK